MRSAQQYLDKLKAANIHPSNVRIRVLQYLEADRNHPTAEMVYSALKDGLPTLSLTSVYNTLSLFEKYGVVRSLSMDAVRYDIFTPDHGHFKCNHCNKIFDFEADMAALTVGGLEGFEVRRRDLFIMGTCPACRGTNFKKAEN
jgi:Fe2+ or Zn2+ uptake regulation protein